MNIDDRPRVYIINLSDPDSLDWSVFRNRLNFLGFDYDPKAPGWFSDPLSRSPEDLSLAFGWLGETPLEDVTFEFVEGTTTSFNIRGMVPRGPFFFKPSSLGSALGFSLKHRASVYDWSTNKLALWKVWDAVAAQSQEAFKLQNSLGHKAKQVEREVKYGWYKTTGREKETQE